MTKKNKFIILASSLITGASVTAGVLPQLISKKTNSSNTNVPTAAGDVTQYDLGRLDDEDLCSDASQFIVDPYFIFGSNHQAGETLIINRINSLKTEAASEDWEELPSINDLEVTSIDESEKTVDVEGITDLQYTGIGHPTYQVKTQQNLQSIFSAASFTHISEPFDSLPSTDEILLAIMNNSQNTFGFTPNQTQASIQTIINPPDEYNYRAVITAKSYSLKYTDSATVDFIVSNAPTPTINLSDYIQNDGPFSVRIDEDNIDYDLISQTYYNNMPTIGSAFTVQDMEIDNVVAPDESEAGTARISVNLPIFEGQYIDITWNYTTKTNISTYITSTELGRFIISPIAEEILLMTKSLNEAPENLWDDLEVTDIITDVNPLSATYGQGSAVIQALGTSTSYYGSVSVSFNVGYTSMTGPLSVSADQTGTFSNPSDIKFTSNLNVDNASKDVTNVSSLEITAAPGSSVPSQLSIGTDGTLALLPGATIGNYELKVTSTLTGYTNCSRSFVLTIT